MIKKLAIAFLVVAVPAAYAIAQAQTSSGIMGGMMQGGMTMKHGMQMSEADKGYMRAMQTMDRT